MRPFRVNKDGILDLSTIKPCFYIRYFRLTVTNCCCVTLSKHDIQPRNPDNVIYGLLAKAAAFLK